MPIDPIAMSAPSRQAVSRLRAFVSVCRMATLCALLAFLALMASCAQQGYPEGGPRDVEPPKPLATYPAMRTVNFAERSFSILFDEYVTLNDVDNNVLVSPPIRPKPTFTVKGKAVQVGLSDSLMPNTTYLFQFKEAVADYHEGNKLPNFEFAFSTGDYIDSLALEGQVLDAQTLQPDKNLVTVLLYADGDDDSVAANGTPSYITRCGADGNFRFSHIKGGRYRLIALEDADKDLRLGASEAVAFADSLVTVWPVKESPRHELRISKEETQTQRIAQSQMTKEGYAEVVAVLPMTQPSIECDTPAIWRLSPSRDTLRLWTLDPKANRLTVILADSSGLQDTLKLQFRQRRKAPIGPTADSWCKWAFASTVPYFQPLSLHFSVPADSALCQTDSTVSVMRLSDSTVSCHSLSIDSSLLSATLDFVPVPDERYVITLAANTLRNIFNASHDTLRTTINVQGDDKYGAIIVTLANVEDSVHYVVQLTDGQGHVKESMPLRGGTKAAFRHLAPATYRIQAFADYDRDGQWTPGNYWLHRQPEKVFFLDKSLELRANWDIEETFAIGHEPADVKAAEPDAQ